MTKDKYNYVKKNDFSTGKNRGYKPSLQLEPIHQTVKLRFNIEKEKVNGSVSTVVKANVNDVNKITLDGIDFDIHEITGVDYWDYDNKKIRLIWGQSFKKDEKREFTIVYSVEKPISGLYFSYPDDKYPERPKYVVSDHETQRARYWLPCVDHTAIRCSIDFELTSNLKHTILANGEKIDEKQNKDGTKTVFWKQEFPCPAYLLTIAIGEFIEYKDKDGDAGQGAIPVAYYTTNNYAPEDLKRAFDRTPEMLDWLWKKFKTPIDWPKYCQIATSRHSGAMENISLVTWGDFAVLDENKHKEMWWILDAVNIHEMAHSLFGDQVVCDEFAHAWLKESWAVYVESLYYEETRDKNEFLYDLYMNAKRYMSEVDNKYARPIVTNVYDSTWDLFDATLYPGGAWRIHMLRQKIGDECFFEAVTDYLQSFKGKTVRTIDFQRKLEKHSGIDLEQFFDQWLYSPGYPKLKVNFEFDADSKLGKLKVEQTQQDDKKGIGLFIFPLEVLIGQKDGSFRYEKFRVSEEIHTFYFKCEDKPTFIQLDPNYKILFSAEFNLGDKMLICQMEKGNIIGKIIAAHELAKTGKKKNLIAIKESYTIERFWGLKREFAKALSQSPNFLAIEYLIEILDEEKDPLVLSSIIGTMYDLRYDEVFAAAKRFLKREEPLYIARANALRLIGSQRSKDAVDFLLNFEIGKDFQDIILQGKYNALGRTRTEEAFHYLLSEIKMHKIPEKARRAVINALVDSTLWLKDRYKEQAIDEIKQILLQERYEEFAIGFARALLKLNDTTTIPIIEGIKAKIAEQDHPMIDRWINRIRKRKTSEEGTKQLRTELDEVKKKVKKLHAKIEELENK